MVGVAVGHFVGLRIGEANHEEPQIDDGNGFGAGAGISRRWPSRKGAVMRPARSGGLLQKKALCCCKSLVLLFQFTAIIKHMILGREYVRRSGTLVLTIAGAPYVLSQHLV